MPYINVRGVEHYYEWIRKPSDALSKPVMVFSTAAALNDIIEFVMIPDTAHFAMLSDADTYLHRVREFLN